MKYTISKDGVERCSFLFEKRLTRHEVAEYTAHAKRKGMTLKEWIQETVTSIDLYEIQKNDEEYDKEYDLD